MSFRSLFFAVFALIININISYANFMVTPTSELIESGSSKSKRFVVKNFSKKEIVFESSIIERGQEGDKDTLISLKDYKKLFKIYPKIVKIKPNQEKAIVLKWIGDASIETERAFFLKVAEKNINKGKNKQTKINILMEYYLNLFVVPKNRELKVEILSSEYMEKENQFKIKIRNKGNVHFVSSGKLILIKKEKGVETTKSDFSRDEIRGFSGKVILPGKERTLTLKAPKNFEGKDVVVKLVE